MLGQGWVMPGFGYASAYNSVMKHAYTHVHGSLVLITQGEHDEPQGYVAWGKISKKRLYWETHIADSIQGETRIPIGICVRGNTHP